MIEIASIPNSTDVLSPVIDRAAIFAMVFAAICLSLLFGGMLWAVG